MSIGAQSKADVTLLVDHAEDVNLQLPMVSRVLHLLMIDILAVGVALQRPQPLGLARGSGHDDALLPAPRARRRAGCQRRRTVVHADLAQPLTARLRSSAGWRIQRNLPRSIVQ